MDDQNNPTQKETLRTRVSIWLRRLPIPRRLFLNALVSILSLVFIMVLLGINANVIFGEIDRYINDTAVEVQLVNQIGFAVQGVFSEVREYALSQEASTLAEIEEYLDTATTSMFALLDTGTGIEVKAESADEEERLDKLLTTLQELEAKISGITYLITTTPEADDEIEEALEELEEFEETLLGLIEAASDDFAAEAQIIYSDISQRIITTVSLLTGGMMFFLLINIIGYRMTSASIVKPIDHLVDVSQQIAAGSIDVQAQDDGQDEIRVLANAFNQMNRRQRDALVTQSDLSTRLERNLTEIQASTQVTQAVSSILDPTDLAEQVVNLIQQAFELYYVGLFTVDEHGEWAVLQSGVGQAGRAMLERGHRIKLGEGMIGWSISNAQARVAGAVDEDTVYLATEELPETRSEAAIPLRSRGQVLGALTVQDKVPDAFDEETLNVLQNMGDQIAIALDNARLFAESQAALEASGRAYGEISQEAWKLFLGARPDIHYLATPRREVKLEPREWPPEMANTYSIGDITRPDEQTIHIPIILRDQTLGTVRLRKRANTGSWSDEEIELMDTLVDQLENSLETARLYSDTQLQAERERMTAEITDKLHRALDMDILMQTMIREISAALGAESAFVQLGTATQKTDSAAAQNPFRKDG